MAAPQPSLKGRALRCLAAREHSRAELLRKLAPYEEEPGQLERVLDELQAKGFISEERVAASLLHRRAARLGDLRIRQELQAKGWTHPRWRRRWNNCAAPSASVHRWYGNASSAHPRRMPKSAHGRCVFCWRAGFRPTWCGAWCRAAQALRPTPIRNIEAFQGSSA